ncbi:glycoside hydrolase family 25 protein [Pontibacter sp. HSC-36F09]|uniref:glycoside hydrolase family 25 protein n=1 Tax=Pontibacter sp. HSC-36F09 TaxID=2910966 RepID=UPI0020A12A51|nr:GH25 family lysozyme [Pontibacter sp. HSC-36F09]MCP2042925.1 lysozyme [Pontibacter sp. HSC-36F09]
MMFSLLYLVAHKAAYSGLLLSFLFAGLSSGNSDNAKNNGTTAKSTGATTKTTLITSSSLKGIDVSKWQKDVDWDQIRDADVTFAFVKATQDDYRLDPYFARNWAETKRVGIKRGAYHFFIPAAPVQGQIEMFINTVELHEGDLPPVLDVEVIEKHTSPADMRKNMRIWLEAVTAHYGVKPIIYTNQNFYRRWLQGHFKDYHFWIARYNTIEPDIHHEDKWLFWQYTDTGRLSGVNAAIDLNYFAGDLNSLNLMCVPPKLIPYPEKIILAELEQLPAVKLLASNSEQP